MFDRRKILLVEPSDIFRRTLKDVIETNETSVEILEAEDSQQAAALIGDNTPDVIFMEIALPRRNGVQFIASIKRMAPDARVVVLTSHDSREHREASIANGADYFLSKERSGGMRLLEVIRRAVGR